MNSKLLSISASAFLLIVALTSATIVRGQSPEVRRSFDFREGAQNWQPQFLGYTQYNKDIYELLAEIRALPPELGASGTGFYLRGHNRCDCLGMFLKGRLGPADGVVAGQRYRVGYTVTLASNAQSGCVGAGGAPGEAVGLMLGASQIEPVTFAGRSDEVRLNVESAVVSPAGNIANGLPCSSSSTPYVSLRRTHQHTSEVTANAGGELWMYVGTHSAFEGLTALYYQQIEVLLTPVGTPAPDPVNPPALITDETTGAAIALNALTFTRDPFHFITRGFHGGDERTRVMLFARHAELAQGESADAVTVLAEDERRGVTFQMPVEHVGRVPNLDWLTQIVVRLPSEMTGARDVRVSFNLRGAASNKADIKLASPAGSP